VVHLQLRGGNMEVGRTVVDPGRTLVRARRSFAEVRPTLDASL
jgi:hypothetical protein